MIKLGLFYQDGQFTLSVMKTSSPRSTATIWGDDKVAVNMAVLGKLYARLPTGLLINAICAFGTVAALWQEQPIERLLAWLGLMALTLAFRFHGIRQFRRCSQIEKPRKALELRFAIGAGASGLVWGLTAFFYSPDAPVAEAFLPFIVAGMVGGSLVVLIGSMGALSAFVLAAVSPYIITFCLLGDMTHLLMAGMILIYLAGVLLLARPMSQSVISAIELAQMNDRLIGQLREKSSQLQATFDHVNQGVAVFDCQARLLTWNPRHRELHGYPVHLYRPGTHLRQFLDHDLSQSLRSSDDEFDPRAVAEPLAPINFQQRGSERRSLAVERNAMPGGGFVSTSTDITDHKRVEARMLHLAQHDPLTDLPNRLLFQDRLQQAMARSGRSGSPVGVIVMDLDRFKAINDEAGHRIGDEALKAIARRLRSGLRESDTVARIGGDEFALVLPDLTTEKAAVRISEKMLAMVETPLQIDGHHIDPRASMGVALFPVDAKTAEALLQYADLAMYGAKHAGGGIRLARPMIKRRRAVGPGRKKHSKAVG